MMQQPSGASAQPSQTHEQLNRVTALLRELEPTLTDDQHALLTHLFVERAVLTAMRASVNAQPLPAE